MRLRSALAVLGLGLLAVFCAASGARIADKLDLFRFEAGKRRAATLSRATRERLLEYDEEVRLTYFVTRRETMPAHLAHLEESVRDVLGAFAKATANSANPFRVQVVHPGEHPEWLPSLASSGLATWRARRVEGDGYRDDELWSSLRVGYGARPSAVLNGVGPEMVDRLQELILAQLDELREPRRPRIAIDAPAGFERLRELLRTGAEVLEVDFEASAALPERLDLFFWLEPDIAEGRHLAALESLAQRGCSVVFAARSREATESWISSQLRVSFGESSQSSAEVLQHFGLTPLEGLLLDPRGAEVVGPEPLVGEPPSAIAPWLVRATPDQQDFRTLRGQPNGTLLFRTPLAFAPDRARLSELNLEATVFAGASQLASSADVPQAELTVDAVFDLEGSPEPNAALGAILRPASPWSGQLLMLADSASLADQDALLEHYAHGTFVRILLTSLLAAERVVASRIALSSPTPLDELDGGSRALMRGLVVLLVPGLFALLYLLRARPQRGRSGPRTWRLLLGPALVGATLVLALYHLMPSFDADLTGDGRNRLTAEERDIFADWLAEGVELEWIFDSASSLPPEYRPLLREARLTCEKLAREFDRVSFVERDPEDLAESELSGLSPLSISSASGEVTRLFRVFAHLRLRRAGREVVLGFPSTRSFEALRFRLAHALARLSGETSRIALVAQPPRLSPAEATLEYQRKGLFAPRESDVFSELEALLEEFDFEVERVAPTADALPQTADAVFWMQPRRDIGLMLSSLSSWLSKGGSALVAGQHFRLLSRQLEKSNLRQSFWPEPQYLDLERHYFPELGVTLARDVVFDSVAGSMNLRTRVDAADGSARYVDLPTTEAFLARVRSVGQVGAPAELLLPFPNRLVLDEQRLAAGGLTATPWVRGSGPHWSYAWTGGDLPAEVLRGELPENAAPNASLEHQAAPALYGALIEGTFPRGIVDETGAFRMQETPSKETGRLWLLGNSKVFENELLTDPDYDHELFALRSAAAACLDPQLSAFLSRVSSAPSIAPQSSESRTFWRLVVLAAFPLLLLLVGGARHLRP